MAFQADLVPGSDISMSKDNLTIRRTFRVLGQLPYTFGGDAFDYVANTMIEIINSTYATYGTPMGTLFWNSIQLNEVYYAQHYDAHVIYSPYDHQSGAYQIAIDQAVSNVHITAGERIAGYAGTGEIADNGGVFFNGEEVTGTTVPVAEDRLTISYRHPQSYLSRGYIKAIGELRGYPNSDVFLGYSAGEVRYVGGNFTETETEASAYYAFEISPNVTNLEVAGVTIADKTGFDVISPTWEPTTGNGLPLKKLKCVEIIRPRKWKAYASVFGWGVT